MNNFHDVIDDRIDVVSRGLMGLTIGCARCHDHKFDPISAQDYYALYGVFASSDEPMIPPEIAPAPRTEAYEKFARELKAREDEARRVRRGQAQRAGHRRAGRGPPSTSWRRSRPSTSRPPRTSC